MKKEDLKTRPDLNDEQYLVYLTALPENRGIDVRGLYLDMHEWCAKKRKTPNRKRLLNWIARERDDMPMTMLPSNDVMRKTTAIDAETEAKAWAASRTWAHAQKYCRENPE